MQIDKDVNSLAVIHKANDNSIKMILAEPDLFAEFLRNFIPVDILKDVSPTDIEDISERLISLVSEQKSKNHSYKGLQIPAHTTSNFL